MTNANIILNESVKLMKENKLKSSGKIGTVEINGEQVQIELPEEIHTFNGWKERDYKVKKGEHSNIPKGRKKKKRRPARLLMMLIYRICL